jgi:hypothetical protein
MFDDQQVKERWQMRQRVASDRAIYRTAAAARRTRRDRSALARGGLVALLLLTAGLAIGLLW